MVIEMVSSYIERGTRDEELKKKEQAFLHHFEGKKREAAAEMLDIGRASYNMRDNDNIYMGRLKARVIEAENDVLKRTGAIIAREYGLPCVTGISRATELIKTGDRITVDGYLGIIVIDAHEKG
jgi:signal transduction protein with GAF and PtsI domain